MVLGIVPAVQLLGPVLACSGDPACDIQRTRSATLSVYWRNNWVLANRMLSFRQTAQDGSARERVSDIFAALGTVPARCSLATTLARVLLYGLLARATASHPSVALRDVVDDVGGQSLGASTHEVQQLGQAGKAEAPTDKELLLIAQHFQHQIRVARVVGAQGDRVVDAPRFGLESGGLAQWTAVAATVCSEQLGHEDEQGRPPTSREPQPIPREQRRPLASGGPLASPGPNAALQRGVATMLLGSAGARPRTGVARGLVAAAVAGSAAAAAAAMAAPQTPRCVQALLLPSAPSRGRLPRLAPRSATRRHRHPPREPEQPQGIFDGREVTLPETFRETIDDIVLRLRSKLPQQHDQVHDHEMPPLVPRILWNHLSGFVKAQERGPFDQLPSDQWLTLRLDGCSWGTLLDTIRRSGLLGTGFSDKIAEAMMSSCRAVMREFGACLAYTHSD
ncbi:unnamed protein product, partial [Prorocentrum cordatum]